MSESYFHVGDIGVELRANVHFPLNDAKTATLLVFHPAQSPKQFEAEIIDVTNGVISYTTKEGDLDVAGEYTAQANIVFNDGSQLSGASHTFTVHNLFE